ncbi:MAG: outer membrane lipoprotein carrier protein LolA [Deltaproteobacteria bacterium]|nr:outer membrane lipoprotein carrier protein LolA [Deltaproteobacteria bacterium]
MQKSKCKNQNAKWGIIGVLCCALLTSGSSAGAASLDEQVDTVQRTYQSLGDLQAAFTQATYVKALGKNVNNSGLLSLKKPGKLRIDYHGNPAKQYISNGKTLWITTPGDPQVMMQKLGKAGIPREALAFLTGFAQLRELFTVTAGDAGKRGAIHLTLTPKRGGGFRRLDAAFNERGLLTALTVHNNGGGTASYRFSNIRTNVGIDDGLFHFSPPAGSQVIRP